MNLLIMDAASVVVVFVFFLRRIDLHNLGAMSKKNNLCVLSMHTTTTDSWGSKSSMVLT